MPVVLAVGRAILHAVVIITVYMAFRWTVATVSGQAFIPGDTLVRASIFAVLFVAGTRLWAAFKVRRAAAGG